MHLNISSVKWRPFCPGGDELMLPRAFILNILLCSLLERDSVWHHRQWPRRALLRTLVRILWVPHLVMGLSLSLSLSLSIYSEYLTLLLVRARQCLAPQAMAKTGSATHTRPNTVGPHLVMGLSLSLSLSLSIYSQYLTLLLVRARQCLAPQAMAKTGSATHTRPNTVGSPSCDGSESEFESESEHLFSISYFAPC